MINFNLLDYCLIILYFLIALIIGLRTKNTENSKLQYLLAGRTLTLPAFVATLVSTFYGGILGVGEFVYTSGISSWFLYAFPFYVFVFLFAMFFAKKIRQSNFYTIPDKLEKTYGKKVSVFGALMVFLLITPAPYVFMLGVIISLITGISIFYSTIACLLISTVFLFKGGLKADVNVNIFEFALMYLGFIVIIPFCISVIATPTELFSSLDDKYLDITGGNSIQYILVWFFIGAWAIVDPSFHQRCYAAKDEKTARNGVLISLIFWFVFDTLTTLTGLYAVLHLQNLENPVFAYPLLAESVLPTGFKAIFFIGLIATIMSTLHSYVFISGSTIGNDLFPKFFDKNNKSGDKNFYTQIGLVITGLISLLIIYLLPSVVSMWYTLGSIVVPALLISVISSYYKKLQINSNYIFTAMIFSFLISLLSFIYGYYNFDNGIYNYFLGLEPMYPGLFAGLFIFSLGLIKKFRTTV
ncbi:MAG TPA: hypothetical protein DEP28_11070 [Bacteroidetes bacterium]|nr:sodium:solute symporter family protein [Ignavibacteria bacterium]HCA43778.1 hypothetical protein [Bacteroidota bacterium]